MSRKGKTLTITVPAELVKRLRVNQQMVDVTKAGDEWREVEPGTETTIELVVDRSLAPELADLFSHRWKSRESK